MWAVNDTLRAVSGAVTLQLLHPGRNGIREQIESDVTVAPGESQGAVLLDQAGHIVFRAKSLGQSPPLTIATAIVKGRLLVDNESVGSVVRRQ